jgi:hypothetical protein
MLEYWYYTHGGQTHGPIPTEDIKRLAVAGLLQPDDLLWPATGDRRSAVPACAALDFSTLVPAPVAVPNRLQDVEKAEQSAGHPPEVAAGTPDWLADVARSERLPDRGAGTPSGSHGQRPRLARRAPIPPVAESVPLDWLEDIREIEESLRRRPRPRAASPLWVEPAAEEPPTVDLPAIPVALPVARAVPPPGQPPSKAPAPSPESMGFNPETGQILDRKKFDDWQREQQLQRQREAQTQPVASVYDAFLNARRALHEWVDDEQNRDLILAGNMEAIRGNPIAAGLVLAYEGYGETMLTKLWKHLELLVDNRRKFLATRG